MLKGLVQNGEASDLTNLNEGRGIPLSANIDIILCSVKAESVGVFTSANKPLKLPFYYRLEGEE